MTQTEQNPAEGDEPQIDDATVVVRRPRRKPEDTETGTSPEAAVGAEAEAGFEVEDATVVVVRPDSEAVDDATVVVPRSSRTSDVVDPDATVVVARPREAPDVVDPDATVVVARPREAPDVVDPDATVVVARPRTATEAPAAAPANPEFETIAEHQNIPATPLARAIYGARSVEESSVAGSASFTAEPPAAFDEPPPLADRTGLPSLARRFKRQRIITLLGYAGALLVTIVGLVVVFDMAFISK